MSIESSTPVNGPFSLTNELISHVSDLDGKEFITFSQDTPYPKQPSSPLANILLPEVQLLPEQTERILQLPNDFISFPSVLNEAFSNFSRRSDDFLEDTLKSMGRRIRDVRMSGQGVPRQLSYRQIIMNRESFEFFLLPPIEMVSESNLTEPTIRNLIDNMDQELISEAGNRSRAERISGLFASFREAAEGR